MNCFQFFIFVTSGTTTVAAPLRERLLWIAFNFLSLWRQEQHIKIDGADAAVVNCFQFFIFVTSGTTQTHHTTWTTLLWIAFNFLSLWRQEQLTYHYIGVTTCCELLSIFYLCDVRNNLTSVAVSKVVVVNCFQFFIFVTSGTTESMIQLRISELWIAFNFLSLWRQEQRFEYGRTGGACCELLSIFYLCDVRNNFLIYGVYLIMLWIAFNFLSLWRQEQRF